MREISSSEVKPIVTKLKGMRRTIARRMHNSLQNSAQLTLHTKLIVKELVDFKVNNQEFSYNEIFIKATARALMRHPRLNSTIVENEIHQWPSINVGVAVALEDGLIVPVIQNANEKSLSEIKEELAELVYRGKLGKLKTEEVTTGTFTISNLGKYPIDYFTPILNPPQVALLGIGRLKEEPVVLENQIQTAPTVHLSLTIDHQVIDGVPGAAFLKELEIIFRNPEQLKI